MQNKKNIFKQNTDYQYFRISIFFKKNFFPPKSAKSFPKKSTGNGNLFPFRSPES